MNELYAAAAEIQTFCRDRSWRFCVIGGLAVLRWGQPRQTDDVDLTLLTGFGTEAPFVDALLTAYDSRIPDAASFALRSRVLLLQTVSGVGIDVALAGLPFEERAVDRATDWQVAETVALRTCSAEDLVVLKAFAGRPQDWIDLEMVVVRQGEALDAGLVLEEVAPLLALLEAEDRLDRLRGVLGR